MTATYTEGVLPHFMRKILTKLSNYDSLTYEEAYETLHGITNGMINEAQTIAFISAFVMRRITFEELKGFRQAMIDQCHKINLRGCENAIDIVGTGGDGKNTFNISTLAAIVVASTGRKVIKHGNYGSTSVSGSSNVLEFLGYKFSGEESELQDQLDKNNICFLHAPLFHPAMKNVAAIRKNLGIRTFFNLLGPLTNPANPQYHMVGTNNLSVARMYHILLQDGGQDYTVLHNVDGYDEVSLTAQCKIYGRKKERLLDAESFGLPETNPHELDGGKTVTEAAEIFMNILENKSTASQKNAVLANAGLAIQTLNPDLNLSDSVDLAREALESGKSLTTFNSMINKR